MLGTRRFGLLLGTALVVVGLAAPATAVACSCVGPQPLQHYVTEPTTAVLVGWVGPQTPEGFAFRVERWYAGAGPTAVVTMVPGESSMCGISIRTGQHLFAVAWRDERGLFNPSICTPNATVESPEGQALIAEAERTFGGGPLASPEEQPSAPIPSGPGDGIPWPLFGLAGLGGMLVGMFAVLRRRSSGE